jgi:hypothetical protein
MPMHVIVLALDAVGTVMALQLAFWLQFDGAVPGPQLTAVSALLPYRPSSSPHRTSSPSRPA